MAALKHKGMHLIPVDDAARLDMTSEDVQTSILLYLKRSNRALENLRYALESDEDEHAMTTVIAEHSLIAT